MSVLHENCFRPAPRGSVGQVYSVYKHLKTRDAAVGDRVCRGERIGTMGVTGALGMMVHLHFEIRDGASDLHGKAHDPQLYRKDGIGRVTCFDPGAPDPDTPARFHTPYPVPCKGRGVAP